MKRLRERNGIQIVRNIFDSLHKNFFKPLNSKYKEEYADCIQLIFNTFQSELSYGVNREIVVKVLEDYYEKNDRMMISYNGEEILKDARAKANETIRVLVDCGWLEYEQVENHQVNLLLFEYAIPVIEGFNKIVKDEEAEYQGIISQIHSSLCNKELYHKLYELVLKGVFENTERLVLELKKLNISIKRHMEKQTNEMGPSQVLEHFFEYHKTIGSKAYLRMKTSENVSYFRSSIVENLDVILEDKELMRKAAAGYMEVEMVSDEEQAYEELVHRILHVKSSFYHLDDIIEEIEQRHSRYTRNAVTRAKFLLSAGNNVESKISQILGVLVQELNDEAKSNIYEEADEDMNAMFRLFPQRFLDGESLRGIPVMRTNKVVDEIKEDTVMSNEERAFYVEALREKNRKQFTRKIIDTFVESVLQGKEQIRASQLPLETDKDLIRLVYIGIYGTRQNSGYRVVRDGSMIQKNGFEFPDYNIIKI